MRKIGLLIIIVWSLHSCFSASYYPIEILQPATIELPGTGKNIVVLTNYELIKEVSRKDSLQRTIDSLFFNEAVIGASEEIRQSPIHKLSDFRPSVDSMLNRNVIFTNGFADKVKASFPDSIDYLIRLQKLQLNNAHNQIYSYSEWIIFDFSSDKQYKTTMADSLVTAQTIEYAVLPNPYESSEALEDYLIAAQLNGKLFAQSITPSWVDAQRLLYKSRQIFRKANKYLEEDDWISAAEVWHEFTQSSDDMISSRACFNMALACEMEGKIEIALQWLKQAEGKGLDPEIAVYRAILVERLALNNLLTKQLTNIY